MAERCASVVCVVWMLLIVAAKGAATNNCRGNPDNPQIVSSVEGMTPSLTVDCLVDSDMVRLSMDSGGIIVTDFVHIFEDCVPDGLDEAEVVPQEHLHTSAIYSHYLSDESSHQLQVDVLSPNDPALSGVVCSYHGCYQSATFEYDLQFYIGFKAANNCTFSRARVSSYHSTASMASFTNGIQPSSSLNQLQPTPVTILSKPGSSSVTFDYVPSITPSPPATASGDDSSSLSGLSSTNIGPPMHHDTNGVPLQLSFLLILLPVIITIVFILCIIQRNRNFRLLKKGSQHKKPEWSIYYDDEQIDVNFSPVSTDMPAFPRFYSTPSIVSDLDELNRYCSTMTDRTSTRISEDNCLPCSEAPTTIDKRSSLYDGTQCDSESENQSNVGYTDLQDRQTSTHDTCELSQRKRVFREALELFAYNDSVGSDAYVHLSAVHDSSAVTDMTMTISPRERTRADSLSHD